MARPGLTLTDPTTGQTITFLQTAAQTDGALLQMESTLLAGKGGTPPSHKHPAQDEHFEVLDGELQVKLGRRKLVLRKGDVLDVPAGTPHAMHGGATVRWEVRPALETEAFLAEVCNPHAAAASRLAAAYRHRAEFRLTGPAGVLLALFGRFAAKRA
jgi:mannose-6-phosphate isomerase-like protein (cupin superfamily)